MSWWNKHTAKTEGAQVQAVAKRHDALPVIYVAPKVLDKLDAYIAACHVELSGLGTAKQIGKDFLVDDILLLPQECSSASTVLDDEAVAKLIVAAMNEGHDPAKLRVWWHSHCDFGTFWSGTDDATINVLGGGDWLISIVGNKAQHYLARLDLYQPMRLTLDRLEMVVHRSVNHRLYESLEEEVKQKVRIVPLPAYMYGYGHGYGSF